MAYNDWDYVNFSEEYELNYILGRYNWSQTSENRAKLIEHGIKCKASLGRTTAERITHREFYDYLDKLI